MLKKYDAFVFDWDGTLNNLRFTVWLNEKLKRALGIWNRDSSIKKISIKDHDLKRKMAADGIENDIAVPFVDLLMLFSKPRLHNDTKELLETLKRHKKRIAIFSNGRSSRLVRELTYAGIVDYFDVIVSAMEIKAMKPNPTGLKVIVKTLGVRPGRTLYIGDMTDDIIVAKLSKVGSCAVANGLDSRHSLKSMRPDYIFNNVEGLKRAL
ncbi:MAG: HAD family hydrolase [Rhabdochlamydiaceae bacterium]